MTAFEQPLVLAAAVPWWLFWRRFAGVQRRALTWVDAHVSPAFRAPLTIHTARSLKWHLRFLLLAGLLLIVAGARPTSSGYAEVVPTGGRALLIVDGSASMYANDVADWGIGETPAEQADGAPAVITRFEAARAIASGLVESLEGYGFGLASFSGVATIHLPVTHDLALVEEALRTVEAHNFYQNTGSSLTRALDLALRTTDDDSPDLQVVLLSDGELPHEEDFGDALDAVAGRGIPVHTVALGTLEGQSRVIYDFRDVIAGKEEKTVLRRYTTRRVDHHLQRISEATGGRFTVGGAGTAEELAAAVRDQPVERARVEDESARTDLSWMPLLGFVACFLIDALWIGRRRRPAAYGFDLDRVGEATTRPAEARPSGKRMASVALLLLIAGCDAGPLGAPLWRAHRENERGIAGDRLRRPQAARPHYERSIGYGARSEVPTYNLARSVTSEGGFSEAHDLYQQALLIAPELVEAYYNDGVALFRWGEAERDPRGCELDRTFDLWHQALRRFETAIERTAETSDLGLRARSNRDYLGRELEAMEDLLANPPPECSEPPPPSPSGGGGGDSQEPPPGEPPPAPPPLSDNELDEIRQALARIAEQPREEGKFFRRTGPEQFSKESWENPEAEIWW